MVKQEKSPLDPQNFIDFKLKKVIPYNHNTSEYGFSTATYLTASLIFFPTRFVFELPNNEASLLPVASCVVVKASDPEALKDAKGKPVIRPYTPISSPDAKGELTFIIKKYDNGNASKYIHSLKVGTIGSTTLDDASDADSDRRHPLNQRPHPKIPLPACAPFRHSLIRY